MSIVASVAALLPSIPATPNTPPIPPPLPHRSMRHSLSTWCTRCSCPPLRQRAHPQRQAYRKVVRLAGRWQADGGSRKHQLSSSAAREEMWGMQLQGGSSWQVGAPVHFALLAGAQRAEHRLALPGRPEQAGEHRARLQRSRVGVRRRQGGAWGGVRWGAERQLTFLGSGGERGKGAGGESKPAQGRAAGLQRRAGAPWKR